MLQRSAARLRQHIESFDVFRTVGKVRSSKGAILSCTLPAAVWPRRMRRAWSITARPRAPLCLTTAL